MTKHLLCHLAGNDQLEVKILEENSVDAWIFFSPKGGSCSYDNESINDIKVPLRYKILVKQWAPKDLPEINIYFSINERICHIAPKLLHGLRLFSMDGIKVCYEGFTEFMEYVKPCYNFND